MYINGKCHCGNIVFLLHWPGDSHEIPARACGCSFCIKHGGVWTSNPRASLVVTVRDASLVSKYSFGTKTAHFYVCSNCGIVPVVTSCVDDHLYAVVNVNAFEGVDPSLIKEVAATIFDGESEASRLTRRKQNWIARIEFV